MDFQVSVVIPVFNAERFLREAVESALRQPEVGEVVLVDDGSSDGSPALCGQLAEEHPGKVTLAWHEGRANRGPGPSRNLGLSTARCPYVAFLDADDWYVDGCFTFDKKAFEADPGLGFVRHSLGNGFDAGDEEQAWFVKYTGRKNAESRFHSFVDPSIRPETYFEHLYPMGNLGPGVAGTVTVRRDIALSAGGFPGRNWAEDATFHAKVALVAKVGIAPTEPPMAMRRIHAGNLTRKNSGEAQHRFDCVAEMLLEARDFGAKRGISFRRIAALHRGWLRYGRKYSKVSSFTLLRRHPLDMLLPGVAWMYFRFYAGIILARGR